MITEPFYPHIFNVNSYSLHAKRFRCLQLFVCRYRIALQGLRETGPDLRRERCRACHKRQRKASCNPISSPSFSLMQLMYKTPETVFHPDIQTPRRELFYCNFSLISFLFHFFCFHFYWLIIYCNCSLIYFLFLCFIFTDNDVWFKSATRLD